MFDSNMLCPYCKRLMGKAHSTDEEQSTIKILKNPPKTDKAKTKTLQSRCLNCGKIVYIVLGFHN